MRQPEEIYRDAIKTFGKENLGQEALEDLNLMAQALVVFLADVPVYR